MGCLMLHHRISHLALTGMQPLHPPTHVFPDMPPANSVYMTDAPPPYPGINGNNGYSNGAVGSGGAGGWTAPQANGSAQMTSAERKAAEASAPPVQTGYYDPNT